MQTKTILLLSLLMVQCTSHYPRPFYLELNPDPPGDTASVFARGIISTHHHEHSAPAISPDGREIYWSLWEKPAPADPVQTIYYIQYRNDGWSAPETAPFSGSHTEGGPCFSPDGRKLFFYSQRPADADSSIKGDIDLWYVEREENGWSDPRPLSSIVNNSGIQALPSLTRNQNLYFLNDHENVEQQYGIYRSDFLSEVYTMPVPLPEQINSVYRDWTPFISPDEDYLLFSSHRPGGYGSGDLYLCFRDTNGVWSKAVNMGEKVNTASQERFPMVSPDGKVLFFTRSTDSMYDDIYWVNFGPMKASCKQRSEP